MFNCWLLQSCLQLADGGVDTRVREIFHALDWKIGEREQERERKRESRDWSGIKRRQGKQGTEKEIGEIG